jgi:hypothetical protein
MKVEQTIAYTWDGIRIEPDETVRVTLESLHTGDLQMVVDAPFYGDPPPRLPPGPCWELWNHEVVEAFLVGADGFYLEIELGPHGHHILLHLDRPRNILEHSFPIVYQATIVGDRWQGIARIPAKLIPQDVVRANFFTIHGMEPERRYLAYAPLPGPKPDFHQPGRFPTWSDMLAS